MRQIKVVTLGVDHGRGFNYVFHEPSGILCLGPEPDFGSTEMETYMDQLPEVPNHDVDLDNSLRGSISCGRISARFSTRYWRREDVLQIVEDVRLVVERDLRTGPLKVNVGEGGDYGSDKEKRRGLFDPGSRFYNQEAALRRFKSRMGATGENADMDDCW